MVFAPLTLVLCRGYESTEPLYVPESLPSIPAHLTTSLPRLGEFINLRIDLLVDGTVRHARDALFACDFVDTCSLCE